MPALPRITCYCDTDPVHSSYAVTGLIELADAGEIDLRFVFRDRSLSRRRHPATLWLNLTAEGETYGICIDAHDSGTFLCPVSLAACRYYFKANLNADTASVAGSEYASRLRAFGPYLPCRPRHDRAFQMRRWGNLLAKFFLRYAHTPGKTLKQRYRKSSWEWTRHKRYLSRKVWVDYESPPDSRKPYTSNDDGPQILFNPSCWNESEHPSIVQINEFRARLIVALRENLGSKFVGGFRRDGTAWKKYEYAVQERHLSHDDYVELMKKTPIAVYSNGKWGCFSWRLPENFAAGQCIVSEPLANDFRFPFDESIGVRIRNSPEAMAAEVRRLLETPEELQVLRERSFRLHTEQLRPHVRMRHLIDDAMRPKSSSLLFQPSFTSTHRS